MSQHTFFKQNNYGSTTQLTELLPSGNHSRQIISFAIFFLDGVDHKSKQKTWKLVMYSKDMHVKNDQLQKACTT